MEFFKAEDLMFFQNRLKSNPKYRLKTPGDFEVGQRIKETIFAPSNEWGKLVAQELPEYKVRLDNAWNVSGNLKPYSWARLYPKEIGDPELYFTVGVGGVDASLYIQINYQENSKTLSETEKNNIKKYLNDHHAILGIPAQELADKNWEWLIKRTKEFITEHLANFKHLHTLIGSSSHKPTPTNEIQMTTNEIPLTNPYPKNTILYGPPGTGKTYETFSLAVEIATGSKSEIHETNKKLFDKLQEEKQIGFVTFHQNYTYEDFVIGIKPDISGDSSQLKFELREGVFYRISKLAQANFEASQRGTEQVPFEEVLDELTQPLNNNGEVPLHTMTGVPFSLIGFNPNRNRIRLRVSTGTIHKISIGTLKRYFEGEDYNTDRPSYYEPIVNWLRVRSTRNVTSATTLKNYVLIIDEINRANISRVFGELITLLEEDKRIGEKNALKITLPNVGSFGVPPNLYIIGTMNTADKSLALLDIALRRRFVFKYKKPDPSKLSESSGKKLNAINQAIRDQHKSADFLVGHAYLIDKSDDELPEVFNNKVIPLLLEYFNGNAKTVTEILKKAGIMVTQDSITDELRVNHE